MFQLYFLYSEFKNITLFTKERSDIEWKFSRSKLYMEYIREGAVLPIPFNIIPTPSLVYESVCKVFGVKKDKSLRFENFSSVNISPQLNGKVPNGDTTQPKVFTFVKVKLDSCGFKFLKIILRLKKKMPSRQATSLHIEYIFYTFFKLIYCRNNYIDVITM